MIDNTSTGGAIHREIARENRHFKRSLIIVLRLRELAHKLELDGYDADTLNMAVLHVAGGEATPELDRYFLNLSPD